MWFRPADLQLGPDGALLADAAIASSAATKCRSHPLRIVSAAESGGLFLRNNVPPVPLATSPRSTAIDGLIGELASPNRTRRARDECHW
jgi:hypothetical protein